MKFLQVLACVVVMMAVSVSVFADKEQPPKIVVEGEAEVLLEPDYIEWAVDIRTQDKVPKIARTVNESLFKALLEIAEKADIDDKDIAWGEPAYEQLFPENGQDSLDINRYIGTEVYRRVTLKMRDMDEFDEMLDAVHPLGVFYAVRRKSTQYGQVAKRVKAQAIKDARMKAIDQAAALGQNIGKAIDVEVTHHSHGGVGSALFGSIPPIEEDDTSAGPDGKIRVTAYATVRFRLE